MNKMRDASTVKKQYETTTNLKTRISLHEKYSTNKLGFGNWLFNNYQFGEQASILEVGCGTGDLWKSHNASIKNIKRLVVSDSSEGMVNAARANMGDLENIEYKIVDVSDISFPDGSFDFVIANMMLYHVPVIEKAISEIHRVLKPRGILYCATFGENGIAKYINHLFSELELTLGIDSSFTLQNGGQKLGREFSRVTRIDYPDGFEISDPSDLADYILSLSSLMNSGNLSHAALVEVIEKEKGPDGLIKIPKEYGMFISEK